MVMAGLTLMFSRLGKIEEKEKDKKKEKAFLTPATHGETVGYIQTSKRPPITEFEGPR
jgi:hypothetical protein